MSWCRILVVAFSLMTLSFGDRHPDPQKDGYVPPRHPHDPKSQRCSDLAREFSGINLIGGWRKKNLDDSSLMKDLAEPMELAKALVEQKLIREQEVPVSQSRPGSLVPPLDIESLKIEPTELFTQLVAGIRLCAVFNVNQCQENVCGKPLLQCVSDVWYRPWLVGGEPASKMRDVYCTPFGRPPPHHPKIAIDPPRQPVRHDDDQGRV